MNSQNSKIIPIEGIIKNYPWGSYSALARHQGKDASVEPEAELWFGDHPQGPAKIIGSIDTLEQVTQRFGSLPFLAKILAVEHSLSLQVHPALTDIPSLAAVRKDENHKPEMVIALTRFEALVGFASSEATLELLRQLNSPHVDRLLTEPIGRGATHRELLEGILGVDDHDGILDSLLEGLGNIDHTRAKWLRELVELYAPKLDPLATLLCDLIILEPGECIYLPPRCVHAYLNGVVVEIMANSDNVIRGGLTHKAIDKGNFLALIDLATESAQRIEPNSAPGVRRWNPPISDFSIREFHGTEIEQEFDVADHSIAFAWHGHASITPSDDSLSELVAIGQRNGALLPPGSYHISGHGSLWVATGKGR